MLMSEDISSRLAFAIVFGSTNKNTYQGTFASPLTPKDTYFDINLDSFYFISSHLDLCNAAF